VDGQPDAEFQIDYCIEGTRVDIMVFQVTTGSLLAAATPLGAAFALVPGGEGLTESGLVAVHAGAQPVGDILFAIGEEDLRMKVEALLGRYTTVAIAGDLTGKFLQQMAAENPGCGITLMGGGGYA
jgi:hypothetical protein